MLDNLSVEKQEITNALIDYYYYSLDHRNFTDPDYIKVTEVLMKWIEEDKNVLVQFDGEEKKVAIVSLKKLNRLFLIAGPVAKIPTLLPSSGVLVSLK